MNDKKESAVRWHMENCKRAIRQNDGSYIHRPINRQEAEAEVEKRQQNKWPLTGWNKEPADVN